MTNSKNYQTPKKTYKNKNSNAPLKKRMYNNNVYITPRKLFNEEYVEHINPTKQNLRITCQLTPRKLFIPRKNNNYQNAPKKNYSNSNMSSQITPRKLFGSKYSENLQNAPIKNIINRQSFDIEPKRLFKNNYENNLLNTPVKKSNSDLERLYNDITPIKLFNKNNFNQNIINAPIKRNNQSREYIEMTPKRLFSKKYANSKRLNAPVKPNNNSIFDENNYQPINLYQIFLTDTN